MLKKILFFYLFLMSYSFAQLDISNQSVVDSWREYVDNFSASSVESEIYSLSIIEDVVKIGKKRAEFLRERKEEVGYYVFGLSDHYFDDTRRELQLVPIKWLSIFKLKISSLRNQLNSDYIGLAQFIFEILKLLGIIIIPFVCYLASIRVTESFKTKRAELIRGFYRGEKNFLYTEALRILISYGPWFVSWFALWLSYKLLQSSEYFSELAPLIYVFRYYIYFKLFQKIVVEALLKISKKQGSNKAELKRIQAKAKKHASRVAGVIMLSQGFAELVGTAVNKGLVYHSISVLAIFVLIALVFITSSEWKEDLSIKLKSYQLPFISDWFAENIKSLKFFFLCFPALFLVLLINIAQITFAWAERFDFMKKITAKIFKRKLESSELAKDEDNKSDIPTQYFNAFKTSGKEAIRSYVNPENSKLEQIFQIIELWKDDQREENSLALIGEKGAGKSMTLALLEERFKDLNVVHLKLKRKLTSAQDAYQFIGENLGVELKESIIPLIKFDEASRKSLIIIDDAHNCFLSKVGSFEAYKTLLTIVNARLDNLFFCFSFDLYAWNYLASAFKRGNSFRHIIQQNRFNESDIKSLILKRHDEQNFKLLYYDILKASGSNFTGESREAVTEQFFRLLWEQSLGNPAISMDLWLSSLKYQGGDKFKLGLPHDDELKMLNELGEQSLFVYAAIVKHENLSVKGIKEITSIIESDVRYAIRFGLDNDFLKKVENSSTYTFNSRYQHSLVSYLKKKNLVYAK